jgi:glycosyltransferase involved in cell wall biosynthesis
LGHVQNLSLGGSVIATPRNSGADLVGEPGSRRLNVLFITLADLPEGGGNTNRLKMLLTAVAESGHNVSLLNEHALGFAPRDVLRPAGRIGEVEYQYVLGSINRQFGFRSVGTKLRAVLAMARQIRLRHARNKIDVLWFNQLSFYNTYPLTRLAKILGISTIQSYEDERPELVIPQESIASRIYGIDLRLADQYCPRMAEGVVVISRYLARKYAACVADPTRVHVVPTIVDNDYWYVDPEPQTDPVTLLYAGSFAEQDEMANLIDALAMLRSRGRRFRLIALGSHRDPGRIAAILSRVKSQHLQDRVEMPGFVPLETVRRYVAEANILLNIRRDGVWSRSGLSTKLSEYLASGRAVICTDLGDASFYLQHRENAILVPAETTAEQIAEAIDLALSSAELRQKIGSAGREVARRWFDVRVAKLKLNAILQSIVPQHSNAKIVEVLSA